MLHIRLYLRFGDSYLEEEYHQNSGPIRPYAKDFGNRPLYTRRVHRPVLDPSEPVADEFRGHRCDDGSTDGSEKAVEIAAFKTTADLQTNAVGAARTRRSIARVPLWRSSMATIPGTRIT